MCKLFNSLRTKKPCTPDSQVICRQTVYERACSCVVGLFRLTLLLVFETRIKPLSSSVFNDIKQRSMAVDACQLTWESVHGALNSLMFWYAAKKLTTLSLYVHLPHPGLSVCLTGGPPHLAVTDRVKAVRQPTNLPRVDLGGYQRPPRMVFVR